MKNRLHTSNILSLSFKNYTLSVGFLILMVFTAKNVYGQMGTAASPFTSLGQAQNVSASGVYYFNLSGTTFSTYVQTGGWVQVAIHFAGANTGNLTQSTSLTNSASGILNPTVLSKLGSANVARIYVSTGQLDIQNTRSEIIARIVANQALLKATGDNTFNHTNWTGTNTLNTILYSNGASVPTSLHENIMHAGAIPGGIHWLPYYNQRQIIYDAGEIPAGNYFQLLVKAPSVAVVNGPTINTQPSTAVQNICFNGTLTPLSVSATSATTISYQWYSNTNPTNSGGSAISGATVSTFSPLMTTDITLYYYVVLTNAVGSTTSNVSGAITVGSSSISGSISGANTVASGTNSTVLTLSGHTGSVQWQNSTNGTIFANIGSATSSSYTATNLTTTSYYRAVITSGGCASATSSSVTILVVAAPTSATTLSISGNTNQLSVVNNTETVVDADLLVTGAGVIAGFSATISENYTAGDILSFSGTLPSGVTAAAFNTVSRSLVFSGSATAADWQALLRTVRIKTTSVTCNPESRKVVFSASTNFYNYFNGHYYECSPALQSWTDAKAFAASKSFYGRQGYLVTISSSTENSYVSTLINQNTWIGCSDNYSQINAAAGYTKYASQSLSEGKWHWITGPEKGIQVRTGNASTAELPGSAVSGVYQNWNTGGSYSNNEPNDVWSTSTRGQEDYGHLYTSGKWNDFPNGGRACIIEYGDMTGDTPINTLAFTRNITVSGSITGNITGGNVTVCPLGSATLTLNGSTGSVLRWESSVDNFLITENIQTIANTTTTLNLTSLAATNYYRCVMLSGGCTLATNAQPVSVSEIFAGAVTANSNQVCANSAAQLSVNGYTGSILKWQFTTNTSSAGTDIASSTAAVLSHTQTSAGTYYYRCVIGSVSPCSSDTLNTEWYPVTVVSGVTPSGGAVSTNYHCGVNNIGAIQLSGASGGSYQWQISSDAGTTWANVSGATSTTLSYQNIVSNRKYRVLVSNGTCGTAYSSVGAVELYGTNICQWTGAINNTWTNTGNWCSGVIADDGRSMDVSATAVNELHLDASRTISTLRFNSGSKMLVLGNYDLTVSQVLGGDSLNYVQTSGTGSLRASLTGTGGSLDFAVGKSTYNPVTITNNSGSADYFTVRVSDLIQNSVYLSSAKYVNRTWNIGKATANGGFGISFLFNWYESQVVNGPVLNPVLNHYGTNWQTAAGTSAAGAGSPVLSMTHTGYTGTFSPFAISDGSSPLPVSMSYFNLNCVEEDVELIWQTASEHNSDYFQLETSLDGITWGIIKTLLAAGFSQEQLNYSAIDQDAARDQKYYRLKQVDFNGAFEMYGPLIAGCAVETNNIDLHPNPCVTEVTLSIASQIPTDFNYTLISPEGKVLEAKQMEIQSGITLYTLDVSDYPSGMYLLQFDINEKRFIKKLTVQ